MAKISITKFQDTVDDVLIRHRNALDILTKLQESSARVNRAVIKASTQCGCIEIVGKKQPVPGDISYSELKNYIPSQLEGALCDVCREKIEQDISINLFFLAGLCNILNTNMEDMLANYKKQLKTLGKFGLL